MNFGYQYILLIITGLVGVIYGLPAAHRQKFPVDIAAALVVLVGVIAVVMGILLTFIPAFFQGR
jgi:Ca2+/Na+ antiporter